jgi:hypothetical protein
MRPVGVKVEVERWPPFSLGNQQPRLSGQSLEQFGGLLQCGRIVSARKAGGEPRLDEFGAVLPEAAKNGMNIFVCKEG